MKIRLPSVRYSILGVAGAAFLIIISLLWERQGERGEPRYPLFLISHSARPPLPPRSRLDRSLLTDGIRDPFPKPKLSLLKDVATEKKTGGEGLDSSGYTLSAILWDESVPMAVVNDSVVHVGDTVKGIVVKKILKDQVIGEHGGREYILKLHGDFEKIEEEMRSPEKMQ
ncbi:MAG: hypothetical protein WCP22_03760 [Chlamydiota bacterium]